VNILSLIDETFCAVGFEDWKDCLIALGCDEASVNTGIRNGIGAQLKASKPYILVFHCAAHRLELVMKDCFKTDCERGFSKLKRFKTHLRNRLGLKFVSDMINVKLNTQDFRTIDTTPFVQSWFDKKTRRVNAKATGERRNDPSQPIEDNAGQEELLMLADSSKFFG
jgi:hypothetical protein